MRGVVYTDVDTFDAISEAALLEGFSKQAATKLQLLDRIAVVPTEIAYLGPEVPDTLILQELKP